jgi:hypothetical protein
MINVKIQAVYDDGTICHHKSYGEDLNLALDECKELNIKASHDVRYQVVVERKL